MPSNYEIHINNKKKDKNMAKFNVIIEKGEDGYLISDVVELPGCHTQAKTMDELIKRTKEAIALYLSMDKEEERTTFIGLQQIEVQA
jgi:predicted RNase H-like HicB family nuclease